MANLKNIGASIREAYLADVTERLHAEMSPLELYESVQEMRTHLDCMASAYEELGLEPKTAMEQAVSQFGQPEQVAPTTTDLGVLARESYSFGQGMVAFIGAALAYVLVGLSWIWFHYSHQATILGGSTFVYGTLIGGVVGFFASCYKKRCFEFGLITSIVVNALMFLTVFRPSMFVYLRGWLIQEWLIMGIGSLMIGYFCAKISDRFAGYTIRLVRSLH